MPFQPIIPIWLGLNGDNNASPTGLTDPRTGLSYYAGGLNLGDYVDLTDEQAAQNSLLVTSTGTALPRLKSGRYRRVLVDSGATASNVKTGSIGLMVAGNQPLVNRVTSYDKGIQGAHVCVFLNSVTPGNYGWVQELGMAWVLGNTSIQKAGPATGDMVFATTNGLVDDLTAQTWTPNFLGIALSPPSPNTLMLVQLCLPSLQG